MPEIERNRDKTPTNLKTQTQQTSENKPSENKPEKNGNADKAAPQKSEWDLPDGEFSEVIDSEGHRNRINHY